MSGGLILMQRNHERLQAVGPKKAQIRKGIPLAPKHKPGIAEEFPNLRAMAVGDSFEIPDREGFRDLSKAVTSAVSWRIRNWPGVKFKVRTVPGGVGVWRIK